jgi:hypothetical protein
LNIEDDYLKNNALATHIDIKTCLKITSTVIHPKSLTLHNDFHTNQRDDNSLPPFEQQLWW